MTEKGNARVKEWGSGVGCEQRASRAFGV